MRTHSVRFTTTLGLFLLLLFGIKAEAQTAFVTFASGGTGNDANPCTRALPCQSLRAAMNQTRTGGKVYVLDSLEEQGLFGLPVTISKSISIIAAGGRAAISGALVVAPEAGGQVLLRGLDMTGAGSDDVQVTTGVGINLVIDDCTIQGGFNGIDFSPQGTTTSYLVVRNSIVSRNNTGILIQPSGGRAVVVLDNVNVNNNSQGITALDFANVTVRNSVSSQNAGGGIRAISTSGGQVTILVEHSQSSHNGGNGVVAVGFSPASPAVLRISDVTITDNGVGVNYVNGGIVYSFGNNSIDGNTATLPPTLIPLR